MHRVCSSKACPLPEIDPGISVDVASMREVAREAGHLALALREEASKTAWDKSPDNPVTTADLAVNTLIARRLGAARPDYGWLSEETVDDHTNRSQERIWVVDPIDGTRAYIREGDPKLVHRHRRGRRWRRAGRRNLCP